MNFNSKKPVEFDILFGKIKIEFICKNYLINEEMSGILATILI